MAFADNNDKNINYAGDFRIKVATIISYRKAPDSELAFRVNILPQLLNLTIVEDVTSPFLTGEIDLADTNDIRTLLPMTGLERLELHVYTPGQDEIKFIEKTTDTLYVYKISKIRNASGTGRQQVYRLYFTSREAYKNNLIRVSKAFAGPIENAVYELVQDEKYLDSRKPLYAEPTATNSKYVIPNLKPYATIKYLSDNAISKKYKNAGYLFYETTRGFNFRSFESLMAMDGAIARPVVEMYATQPSGKRDDQGNVDILKDLKNIESYSFVDAVNQLEEMTSGLFANRLVTHDIYNKRIETHDFDYHETFGEYFHTEHSDGEKSFTKWLHPFAFFDNTGKTISDFPMQKLMNYVQTAKSHDAYEFVPCKDTVPQRVSQRAQMANFHLLMTVPGQTRMNVGQLISFALPYQKPVAHDEAQQLNPYYSGRYLILQLKHKFDIVAQKHTMNMRCVKDAVTTDLPIETDEIVQLTDKVDAIDIYEKDERELRG